jgi:ABC-type multidrug transport system ATPase subunit
MELETTAINMLTGMLKKSSGSASLYGNDIAKNMDLVQ